MTLRRVRVTDFRCLRHAELELDPAVTLISGPNASGKTSLLEALYLLGRGRSFRTRRLERLIAAGCEEFVVFGELEHPYRNVSVGLAGSSQGIRTRVNAASAGPADLALLLPVQIIDPEVHRLIEEGPGERRRFLDWGVFHVERGYMTSWRRYQQALRQRNAALRGGQPRGAVRAWEEDLLRYGASVHEARLHYVEALQRVAASVASSLLNGCTLQLSYRAGWRRDVTMADALAEALPRDEEAGFTTIGPHRADVEIRLDGASVKDRISRGQQKLLAAALLVSQLSLLPGEPGAREASGNQAEDGRGAARPTLLLDDPAAELDPERLAVLIAEVVSRPVQLVITSLSHDFVAFGVPGRRYRVKAGVVSDA